MSVVSELLAAVEAGDRRALSKSITLVESSRPADAELSRELIASLGSGDARGFRVGVTGVPGAGKSTLIDALGVHAVRAGRRVAVLAIDPSSRHSGGSVLGDKTRMTRLAVDPNAFVRPSPSLGVLGGTAGRTREVILLCERAHYDLIFVETVGVGQSEEQVATMVDCVLLVLLSGAGDELSTMKRGVLEVADIITYNKADGPRAPLVKNEAASLGASLSILRPELTPPVLVASAIDDTGVGELWSTLSSFESRAVADGSRDLRRAAQRRAWFESALEQALRELFVRRPELMPLRARAEQSVVSGVASPSEAALRLVSELIPKPPVP